MTSNPPSSSSDSSWSPDSWRQKPVRQAPAYPDACAVTGVVTRLEGLPPLVAPGEVDRLRAELADAVEGRRFVLQGGDCAERFVECAGPALKAKLKVLLQMSLVLTYATRKPVIRIGRMAGQYAKPRSKDTEMVDGVELPSYRGDIVNGMEADPVARTPDPQRMLEGYFHSAASLNYLRGLIEGGFADLHHPEKWDLTFAENSPNREAYGQIVDSIRDAVTFMEMIGGAGTSDAIRRVEFYTSHEALLLPYESALTRRDDNGHFYNLGAHFLWVGYRTASPDEAHVEYLRGIRNPIGIKVGADTDAEGLRRLLEAVDPEREPGRVTLITRFGAGRVEGHLERLVAAAKADGHAVLWNCDAMHGNTETASDGRKTRRIDAIFSELSQTYAAHEGAGSVMGGVHFELTGEAVTECIGGSGGVEETDLGRSYETACDPRLNGAQALEMAFLIAALLRNPMSR